MVFLVSLGRDVADLGGNQGGAFLIFFPATVAVEPEPHSLEYVYVTKRSTLTQPSKVNQRSPNSRGSMQING